METNLNSWKTFLLHLYPRYNVCTKIWYMYRYSTIKLNKNIKKGLGGGGQGKYFLLWYIVNDGKIMNLIIQLYSIFS